MRRKFYRIKDYFWDPNMFYKKSNHWNCIILKCDSMWVVREADDFFVCFGANPNRALSSRSPMRPEMGEERQVRDKPERVSWQRNPERISWRRETQRGSRERTAEGTSQDELTVQSWQRSAEGGSEEDGQRWVGIPSGYCRSFAKNTLPAIVYKMYEKLYKKVSQNYPSCTWSWHKSILFVCSFSPIPSVVFLVAVWYFCRNQLDESRAMNNIGFKKLMYSRRPPQGCIAWRRSSLGH